ncbi:DUF924 family protein [Oceaniglobus ichthyenteri]|uniref:DUF924 family protein n=1 Tax=Oceaniglobus ichthyenteri TaxID=2136177 RepID=UPI000D3769F1|nr:DUF924 family protein [Oceaniglobus ichthyenteri]
MASPEDVAAFWLDEVGPKGWYAGGAKLDRDVRDRFEETWEKARDGALSQWLTYPSGTLAYIILTDQFPRNMFRDTAQAFETDSLAMAAAKMAITQGWDMRIDGAARQFFYMPLMHSENLCDQDRCVRLFLTRMPDSGASNLLHARVHREIIRKFGRFPYRNAALGRANQQGEAEFLSDGGYAEIMRAMEPA